MYDPGVLRVSRYLWAGPSSVAGLMVASLALWRGRVALVDGVLEAHGPAIAWMLSRLVPLPGGAAAMTFGHVVVARDAVCLASCRVHERVHVRQYERWGPLFIPVYLASSLWAKIRKRHPYFDNPFEVEAFRRGDVAPTIPDADRIPASSEAFFIPSYRRPHGSSPDLRAQGAQRP